MEFFDDMIMTYLGLRATMLVLFVLFKAFHNSVVIIVFFMSNLNIVFKHL